MRDEERKILRVESFSLFLYVDIIYKRGDKMSEKEILVRLLLATLVGGITGIERERSNKVAGFRTHILVSLGACIASITSLDLFLQFHDITNLDPARLSAQVLSGIGFLGAGTIMKTSNGVVGLTTAAGIWSTACIGIAIGYGYYFLALISWFILLIVLYILKFIDKLLKKTKTGKIVLKLEDKDTLPLVLSMLDEMNVESNKLTIDKKGDIWIVNFIIVYKENRRISEIAKSFYDLDKNISIDYCRG